MGVLVKLLERFLCPEVPLDIVIEKMKGAEDYLSPFAVPEGIFQLIQTGEQLTVLGVDLDNPYFESLFPVDSHGILLKYRNLF
jgi:hypothetical protein